MERGPRKPPTPMQASTAKLCEGRMQVALGVGSPYQLAHSVVYLVLLFFAWPLNIRGLPL